MVFLVSWWFLVVLATIRKFDIQPDGRVTNGRVHYSFGRGRGVDGMVLDIQGNVYGAAGTTTGDPDNLAGIYIIGPDLKTLYVTAGKNLYRVRLEIQGYLLYPCLNK